MSEPKFTPGPWVAVSRGCFDAQEEGDVHQKANWDVGMQDGEFMRGNFRMEDAHLIAAAPELYESLNELAAILNGDCRTYVQEALERADAALDKARGEA